MPELTILSDHLFIAGGHPEDWGIIPTFLDIDDPRSAKEQFDAKYIGGWHSFSGFTFDKENSTITYKEGEEDGDPPLRAISMLCFRKEVILLFPSAWVMITHPDDSWEISRMD